MKIAISSGHGKFVRGAAGPAPWGLDEVNEARKVVEAVADILRDMNVDVETFHDNVSHSQNENLNRIVSWHNDQQRDLDVSVHFNSYDGNAKGHECLYVSQSDLAAKESKASSDAASFVNRGAKYRSDLFFLNNTSKPAILIETCFVDNKTDVDLYHQHYGALCEAMAQSISGQATEIPPKPPVERPPIEAPTPGGEKPVISEGDSGPLVVIVQKTLGLPPDGDFGAITKAGVVGFQRAWAVAGGADGVVGENTWEALDVLDNRMVDGDDGIPPRLADEIDNLVDNSPALDHVWQDRGKATEGYIAGMAKTYALAVRQYQDDDPSVLIMAKADSHNPDKDALSWYATEFRGEGMDNSRDGLDTLRHLFVMMVGLGMRESSGNHWEGRDMSASNATSDTAEAGLFQTSWNIHSCASEINDLFIEFKRDPNGFRSTFTEDIYPNTGNLDNYGSGDGCYYQWLAKYCPAFAVFVTAVGMRRLRQHWGPINRKEVEIVQAVDDLLLDVEQLAMGEVA